MIKKEQTLQMLAIQMEADIFFKKENVIYDQVWTAYFNDMKEDLIIIQDSTWKLNWSPPWL